MQIVTEPAKRAAALSFLRCRPFHGLAKNNTPRSWGLRPRLYAYACFAGYEALLVQSHQGFSGDLIMWRVKG